MILPTSWPSKGFNMRWIIAWIFLATIPFKEAKAHRIGGYKARRSIDLNEYEYSTYHHRPVELMPESYHLSVEPLMNVGKFVGSVKVNVTCVKEADWMMFDAHPDLTISNEFVVREMYQNETGDFAWRSMDKSDEPTLPTSRKPRYVIHLQQMLKKGNKYEVSMTFEGNLLTTENTGLFMNEYVYAEGQKHQLVATYFRLNAATKMFPCLVDPSYKATFKLSVKHPRNMISSSNTPIESTDTSDEPEKVWTRFAETPRISTYQLAFIVSNLTSIEPTNEVEEINGTKLDVRIWARKDYLEALRDVPNKIVKIINYLQDYFNCSIGLPKLDVVAVPMFNAAKASDSWGLMFFKESELSSPLIWNTAYELIYQWIGQYITPYHWSDAPVSKALNSFLASMTTVDINPDEMEGKWPMTMLYSLYYEYGKAIPFSSVGVGIRREATSAKTELLFRMFNYTLGKDVIRESVRNFLRQTSDKHEGRIFYAEDIYTRLNEVASGTANLPEKLTINDVVDPWVRWDRLPLVTVTRNYENKYINLSQKVYVRNVPPPDRWNSHKWDIPIVMLTEKDLDFSQTKPVTWLTSNSPNKDILGVNLIVDPMDKDSFVIVNPEEIGMFPVNYDTCNWEMLAQFLCGPKRETIPVLTRAKLLHDSWNLAYAGELCFGVALNMTLFLKEERSHVVWEPVFTMIDHIGRRIVGTDVYAKFEAYIRYLLKPLYMELGDTPEPGEPSWKAHLRGLAKNFLCRVGYEPCIKEARDQYSKWLMDEKPDKGNPVANEFICPVFKWGSIKEWEFGLQRVINFPRHSLERKQNERTYLLKTLAGCPKDPYKIERLLNVTILEENDNFTNSDIRLIFSMMTSGAGGYTTLFKFLNDHWDTIKQRFEDQKSLWHGIIKSATSSFNTQEGYDMVFKLYQTRQEEFKTAESVIQEALYLIKHETKLNEKNLPVIEAWLDKNLPDDSEDKLISG